MYVTIFQRAKKHLEGIIRSRNLLIFVAHMIKAVVGVYTRVQETMKVSGF